MLEKVLKTVEQYGMFESNKNVTVALSGGADSVALLNSLLELKEKLGLNISAAHLNHNLRGEEANRDENFVRELCSKLGIELYCESADINAVCAKTGESTELAARRVRYEFLERVSPGVIATAHNANDNMETVIFNLVRGSGIAGLCGIPAVRGRFVRPLINCTREEIESYCAENNLSFVTDSTNLTDDYTRNKIRHNVIPELKNINSSAELAVGRTCVSLKTDNDYLNNEAHIALINCETENGLDIKKLLGYHKAIISRVLREYYKNFCGGELENVHTEMLIGILSGGKAVLPQKITAKAENGVFSLKKDAENAEISFDVKTYIEKKSIVNKLLLNNAVDYDKIVGVVKIRNRLEGDKMRPAFRGVTKTLKQLFCEQKLPIELRNSLPVATDDKGIIWVYGIGADERVRIDEKTDKIFRFEVSKTISGGN